MALGLSLSTGLSSQAVETTYYFTSSMPASWSAERSGGTATYRDNAGFWQQAAEDTQRIDHDVNGVLIGTRIEPPRTNKANHANFAPVDIGDIVVISGDGTASIYDDTAALAASELDGSPYPDLRNGNVIRIGGGTGTTKFRLSVNSGNTNTHSLRVIARTEVAGYSGTIKMTDGIGGTFAMSSSSFTEFTSEGFNPNGTGRYLEATVNAGKYFHIIAIQLEEGERLSYPIITTSTGGQSRGLEYLTTDIENASWFNQDAGGMLIEAIYDDNAQNTGKQILAFAGADLDDGLGIISEDGDFMAHDAVAATNEQGAAIYPAVASDTVKVALSWESGGSTILSKPVKFNTATGVASRATMTDLYVGAIPDGSSFSGWIKSLTVYDTAKTLQEMATAVYGVEVEVPPDMTSPIYITFAKETNGQYSVLSDDGGSTVNTTLDLEDTLNITNGGVNKDIILVFPPQFRFRGCYVNGFNNVIVDPDYQGAHIKGVAYADGFSRALLRINHQAGFVYVNNVRLNGDNRYGLDCIEFGAGGFQSALPTFPTDKVTLQNFTTEGLYNPPGYAYHSDGIQFYGSTTILNVYHFHIASNTQGAFLPPQDYTATGTINMMHGSVVPEDADICSDYPLTIHESNQPNRPLVFNAKNLYTGERTNQGNPANYDAEYLWILYSQNPRGEAPGAPKGTYGAVETSTGVAEFPALDGDGVTLFTGEIRKWTDERYDPPLLQSIEDTEIVPNAPTALVLTNTGSGLDVSWTAETANGADNWGYRVMWRRTTTPDDIDVAGVTIVASGDPWHHDIIGWEEEIVRGATSTTLAGLDDTTYEVDVRAMAHFYDSAALSGTETVAPHLDFNSDFNGDF